MISDRNSRVETISRRRFLKIGGIVGVGLLTAGCPGPEEELLPKAKTPLIDFINNTPDGSVLSQVEQVLKVVNDGDSNTTEVNIRSSWDLSEEVHLSNATIAARVKVGAEIKTIGTVKGRIRSINDYPIYYEVEGTEIERLAKEGKVQIIDQPLRPFDSKRKHYVFYRYLKSLDTQALK